MNANTLLADPAAIEIEKFISGEDKILIVVRTIQEAAECPHCGESSDSLKTRYTRQLTDLPWHDVPIRLELKVRKFRCRNQVCPQKVFCERLPNVAVAYARRTARLMETLALLAFTLGGRGASRLSAQINIPVGKDTLLGTIRRINQRLENKRPVKFLGVDDFAFRKGVAYGTILIDLERRMPIDLLPDRSAATLAEWLTNHPEIEIISRDRASSYADAARTGAPQAKQVADRWHLLKNMSDLVERFFLQNHRLLMDTARQLREQQQMAQPQTVLSIGAPPKLRPVLIRRQQLFDEIKRLQGNGKTLRGIARELKASRNTVRRYARCDVVPQLLSKAGRRSQVGQFADYLEKRWCEGEHTAVLLWQEIKEQGFTGAVDAVQRFVQEWRKTPAGKTNYSVSSRGMSPRQATKLLLNQAAGSRKENDYIKKLCEISPAVEIIRQIGNKFQRIVKEKRGDLFDDWLSDVKQSRIQDFENWASGLLADEAAVRNALSSKWSNGQVEGQVNRLKTIKRQMYGRANFDLLRARVLHQS